MPLPIWQPVRSGMPHALIIGGTGMLARAVLQLAERGWRVGVINRTPARLEAVIGRSAGLAGSVCGDCADWRDPVGFARTVAAQTACLDPLDVLALWIHRDGEESKLRTMDLVQSLQPRPRVLHIRGSADRNPPTVVGTSDRLETLTLGFIIEPGGSRWLTNREISDGLLDAIDNPRPSHIIGTIDPWSARPN